MAEIDAPLPWFMLTNGKAHMIYGPCSKCGPEWLSVDDAKDTVTCTVCGTTKPIKPNG